MLGCANPDLKSTPLLFINRVLNVKNCTEADGTLQKKPLNSFNFTVSIIVHEGRKFLHNYVDECANYVASLHFEQVPKVAKSVISLA